MKIADKMKTAARTGQQMANPARANGGNGGCGPVGATSLNSWGPGCPTGNCTADQLASNLGRAFAGERYPCRELTYWLRMLIDANGNATFSDNSKVTICPTRVVVMSPGTVVPSILLDTFEIGNQNQIVGDPIPFPLLDVASYQIIPFVTDCIKAGMPFHVHLSGTAAENTVVYFGIIGPTIG